MSRKRPPYSEQAQTLTAIVEVMLQEAADCHGVSAEELRGCLVAPAPVGAAAALHASVLEAGKNVLAEVLARGADEDDLGGHVSSVLLDPDAGSKGLSRVTAAFHFARHDLNARTDEELDKWLAGTCPKRFAAVLGHLQGAELP